MPCVAAHGIRVAALSCAVAMSSSGTSRLASPSLVLGALYHDFGKVFLPHEYLHFARPLDTDEWKAMRLHPRLGADYLSARSDLPLPREALAIIEQHHERSDGRGYPSHLRDDKISPRAGLVAVADAYIAMREHRSYNMTRTHENALAELRSCAGSQFHESFVAAIHNVPATVAERALTLLPLAPCEHRIQEIAHAV